MSCLQVWVGFAWGILYVLIEYVLHSLSVSDIRASSHEALFHRSIAIVFRSLHNFSTGEVGTVFITFL